MRVLVNYIYREPFDDPCFDWNPDLVLEGPRLKIEDKQVPGIYIIWAVRNRLEHS